MRLTIDIRPFDELMTEGRRFTRLRIKVTPETGECFFLEKVLPDDFFQSKFDLIFDSAKEEIKQHLQKEFCEVAIG